MSTTFRPSDPSSRSDVPSRLELQLLRIQQRMFIWNVINAAFCCWVIVWLWTSSDETAVLARKIGCFVLTLDDAVTNESSPQGRLSPPMIKDGKRLEVSREPELAVLPVIESADSGKLFVIPPWSAPPPASKATSLPKFKYRYVTETQVNCKTCPGGVCPVK